MVPVQVGDEDPGYPARLDAALLNLNLRTLAAVEYPDLSIVCIEAGSVVGTRKEGILYYLAVVQCMTLLWSELDNNWHYQEILISCLK